MFLTKIVVAILVTIGSVSARNDPPETKGIIYEVQKQTLLLAVLGSNNSKGPVEKRPTTKCLDSNY